ncbi:MAG: hypothetical protein MUO99_06720, partial [Dehalococcoidales bacterium]|nr:hypothetical protein [Dehalococcoidales bacterium]
NRYIISLVLTSCVVNTALAFFGQNDLTLYFTLNIIAFLVITLFYVYLNPRARGALNTIGVVLFAGFMVVVVLKITEILSGK